MKRIALVLALLSFGCFLAAGPATAATTGIDPTSNLIAPASAGGILDTIYGLSNLQRVDDFAVLPNDQIWFNPGTYEAQAQAKFSGSAHDFGYIPDINGNGMFEEPIVPLFNLGGSINGILPSGPSGILTGGPFNFLWTLESSGAPLWTSLPDVRNIDHMVTWTIIDKPNTWVIAWEDLPRGGDQDYNDLVVEVSVSPVPIPPAILLLGSGLVAMVGIRRRFKY